MKIKALVVITVVFLAGRAFATELVTNGGFETGDFTGWTQSGNTGDTGVDTSSANSGSFGAYFGPVNDLGYISQNLSTTGGSSYDLTFFLVDEEGDGERVEQVTPDTNEIFQVFWNGSLIDEIDVPPDSPPFTYTQFTFNGLLATGASTELKFGFRNDPTYWDIDDISVTGTSGGGSGVPESFSTLWLALPLAGMIALLRLGKAKV